MNLDTRKLLFDILQAAREIKKYTDGLTFDDFQGNGMVQAAVERKFQIIGEALNRIGRSDPGVLQHISDYQRIIGFRNIIVHGYDVVDIEILWEAVRDYLPTLISEVEKLMDV
jgi:uncharacterized protein with HEPN domain